MWRTNAFYLAANSPSCNSPFVAWKEIDQMLIILFNDTVLEIEFGRTNKNEHIDHIFQIVRPEQNSSHRP